jgi:hypothetical protein
MFSPPLSRAELSDRLGKRGKELSLAIRELKTDGRLVQRRISAGALTPTKKVVFHFVPKNLELEI